ncbi:MAG: c-type cytochrome biogenesis protein CcmI [Tabrizicola sp.]|jgi:cytochrome c-type biogenesis protein CcmH|nr:c-type cytochrome biogenesis protein CcmI [Tabrizicola sp.]
MAEWAFWAAAVALATGVAGVLVLALRRAPADMAPRQDVDMAVYKDQLADIERDLARGTIAPDEAERLRAEVGRRLLDADRVRNVPQAMAAGRGTIAASLTVLALVIPGGVAAYWGMGAPGYPDMPLEARLADLDAGIAARPSQAEQLERMDLARDAAAEGTLRAELAGVTDVSALRERYRAALLAGEMTSAVLVQERLLQLLGDGTEAQDHADLALALTLEAQGYVSPEAEVQLRETLTRDMTNELARYLVGEMFLQGGRFDQAFKFWRPLVEDGNPEAPWNVSARERIAAVAERAGVRYELPDSAASAIAELPEEERQAMIEGMVAQLADRLATEGGDVEDWERLIRSLSVLERLGEAQSIYDEAKVRFEGRPAELSFLRQAAVESGLNP